MSVNVMPCDSKFNKSVLSLVNQKLFGINKSSFAYCEFFIQEKIKRGMCVNDMVEQIVAKIKDEMCVIIDDTRTPGYDVHISTDTTCVVFRSVEPAIEFVKAHGIPKILKLDYHLGMDYSAKPMQSITTLPFIEFLGNHFKEKGYTGDQWESIRMQVISDHEKRNNIHKLWMQTHEELETHYDQKV